MIKHERNKRLTPIIPSELLGRRSHKVSFPSPFKTGVPCPVPTSFIQDVRIMNNNEKVFNTEQYKSDEHIIKQIFANAINSLQNDLIFAYMIERTLQMLEVVVSLNKQCSLRSLDFLNSPLPEIEAYANLLRNSSCCTLQPNSVDATSEAKRNMETLARNLRAFDLELDPGIGDGNCCFSSIISQLSKLLDSDDS